MISVNNFNGTNTQTGSMGMTQAKDAVSKNIQNQISNAQKQLQGLSSNEEMSMEEKMKKRQEIQKQIMDLNHQLRQHQMEQRREKGQAGNEISGSSRKAGAVKAGSRGNGLSQASMQAVLSADSSMKQADIQGSIATRIEGRAGVLEAEIKQDAGRGNVEAKEKELSEIQQKAKAAASSQMDTLADANKIVEEAAKAEQGGKWDKEAAKKESRDSKADKTGKEIDRGKTAGKIAGDTLGGVHAGAGVSGTETDIMAERMTETVQTMPQPGNYTSVDIRI